MDRIDEGEQVRAGESQNIAATQSRERHNSVNVYSDRGMAAIKANVRKPDAASTNTWKVCVTSMTPRRGRSATMDKRWRACNKIPHQKACQALLTCVVMKEPSG
eukprot:scaffold1055_cov143-Skeletonema_dohrnii-CCMP3373.AAC.3